MIGRHLISSVMHRKGQPVTKNGWMLWLCLLLNSSVEAHVATSGNSFNVPVETYVVEPANAVSDSIPEVAVVEIPQTASPVDKKREIPDKKLRIRYLLYVLAIVLALQLVAYAFFLFFVFSLLSVTWLSASAIAGVFLTVAVPVVGLAAYFLLKAFRRGPLKKWQDLDKPERRREVKRYVFTTLIIAAITAIAGTINK